jgi:hypothetical protein
LVVLGFPMAQRRGFAGAGRSRLRSLDLGIQ